MKLLFGPGSVSVDMAKRYVVTQQESSGCYWWSQVECTLYTDVYSVREDSNDKETKRRQMSERRRGMDRVKEKRNDYSGP